MEKLGPKFSSLPKHNLVGIQSRVDELVNRLCLESNNEVRVIGISGMSGIGKTTLVRALREKISDRFDFHCLIDDISKLYRESGALEVQKRLLSGCLKNEKNQEICDVSIGTCLVGTRLRNARTLIIFDNVDKNALEEVFTGNRDTLDLLRESLGGGSRIIITSRDEHIFKRHKVDDVYQVKPLDQKDAVQLFLKNAFRGNFVAMYEMPMYEMPMYEILSYCQGNPLALKALGSSLSDRSAQHWRSTLTKLREHGGVKDIKDVLQICFNELDDPSKEIFLDIACFFNKSEYQRAKEILDLYRSDPECGLQNLKNRSLITIYYGRIDMHGMFEDLGKCIVRGNPPMKPRKWSRLWNYNDFSKVMSDNKAAKNLEAIDVVYESDVEENHEKIIISINALSKISHLKLLKLEILEMPRLEMNVTFSGSLDHLSNELVYLVWDKYPFESLPPSFQPRKLVELSLINSNIKQLWQDKKPLCNLRRLDLSGSKNLIELPDFGNVPNLEWLNLKGCIKLKKIHPWKFSFVNLEDCRSLTELPDFGDTLNLETLNLRGCTKLKQIHPSIGLQRKLTFLNLKDCTSLVELPHFKEDVNLTMLNLEGCIQLKKIHPSIGLIRKLRILNLKDCKSLLEESEDAEHLNQLCISDASTDSKSIFSIAHKDSPGYLLPSSFTISCMRRLDLSYCNLFQVPCVVGTLHCLESLNLRGNDFASLPDLKELSKLRYLNLEHCKHLKDLPKLPSQTDVSDHSYGSLLEIPLIESVSWQRYYLPFMEDMTDGFEEGAGLNIFNCSGLVEREECNKMALAWMIQLLKAHYRDDYGFMFDPAVNNNSHPRISSVILGSEIPWWFDTQHVGMGSLITIHRPPPDNKWYIGFACCVVFAAHSERETNLKMGLKGYPIRIPVDLDENVVIDKSDHICLFYRDTSVLGMVCEFDIKDKQGFHFEVKKYGYRWITEEDLDNYDSLRKRKRGSDYLLEIQAAEKLVVELDPDTSKEEDARLFSINAPKDMPSSFTNNVFLSFRSEDTRYSFTGNLCRALRDSGIHTFIGDEEFQRGDEITSAVEKEIEDSRFFIIVLSENYASSSFCLNILAYILECVKRKGLLVLPIFYKVDPSNVGHHRGSFGEALANHEKKFNTKMEGSEHIMGKWKMALHEAAKLPCYHFKQGDGYEYEFITKIVELVSSKINRAPLHVADYPVGLESYSEAFNYDVFLSFKGSDTLHGFTGYLYKALHDCGIHTFIDEELQRGEEITPAIVKAIEESRIAIIVLSINYASSSFCLDELATILDCLRRKRLLVLPVFYDVDPSQVQLQKGSYGEALAKHEERLEHSMEKLEKWKMALHQVVYLSDIKVNHRAQYEYKFIEEIVEWVSSKINHNHSHYPVGLRSKVLEVRKLLDVGCDDGVHMLGIHGTDGVGKSTLAREVYNNLIADHFDASCFIENVREKSKKHGLQHLQSILLLQILGVKDINLTSTQQEISTMQQHRLRQKSVLLILDDVDRPEQLQAIVGKPAWFGPGSRVIITTQEEQLLTSYGIKRTYEVQKLNKDDALQFLKWKAFKMHYFDPRYEELLNRAVTYASSLPLALEILGSNLFGKSVEEWKSAIHELERSPNNPIQMILKASFDSLGENERSIFLDIVCCFKGYELAEVQDLLDAHYGHCMKYYIDVLVEKSLVNISHGTKPCYDTITMHDLIAKEIVQQELLTKPGERRRLWSPEDVRQVLTYNTGTSKTEIICVDFPIFNEEMEKWDGKAFQNMQNLKTLIIKNGKFSEGPEYLPNSLRVLEWWGYPSHCLPSDFHPKELAICKLPGSRISTTELTNLLKKFVNVKTLNFSSPKV